VGEEACALEAPILKHTDGSRYAVVARLNQHRDWKNRCAQIQQTQQKTQTASAHEILACNPSRSSVSNAMKIPDGSPTTSGNPNQPPAPMQCGATTEGLCALHGSSVSQVNRNADGRDMIEAALPSIGWDPGRPNGLHHLLTHPTLLRNDATTTENISVPIPPLNPFASMRAPQDEDNDAFDRPSITCGWDPGRLIEPPLLLLHPPHPTLLRNDATTTENISVPIPPLNPFASMRAPQDEDNDTPDRPSITCGWDPGRPNEPPLLLMVPTHSTLLRNDATTTENISVPIPPLNPFASMRAPQDEDNDTPDRPSITCGWDPGRPNEPLLLLLHPPHPTLLRNDATTTELNIVPLPLLNPFASMRAPQDEDNDTALDRSSLVTCGWDPGKDDAEASLSGCETVLACAAYNDDGSTFTDDFVVTGGISGNGLRTTTATTTTPARDFVEKGTAHDDDAVSDDDNDPD
jgi:hypothetical protein